MRSFLAGGRWGGRGSKSHEFAIDDFAGHSLKVNSGAVPHTEPAEPSGMLIRSCIVPLVWGLGVGSCSMRSGETAALARANPHKPILGREEAASGQAPSGIHGSHKIGSSVSVLGLIAT